MVFAPFVDLRYKIDIVPFICVFFLVKIVHLFVRVLYDCKVGL